jgi:two-component system chemotaxis response regulator CheB
MYLGAVDYVPIPHGTASHSLSKIGPLIVQKVKAAAGARVRVSRRHAKASPLTRLPELTPAGHSFSPARATQRRAVLIGVSTGGPCTLEEILVQLPADFPLPILIAQHMPRDFTRALADRLNGVTPLEVRELAQPTSLKVGQVLIARGDADVSFSKRGDEILAMSVPIDPQYRWHPSVDRLVQSALQYLPARDLIGVQLTGMGDDGAMAMTILRQQGGHTIAESEESAIVFGMPKELIDLGGAEFVLPLNRIAKQLTALARG